MAVITMFIGWEAIAGLMQVTDHGSYALVLAIHGTVHYLVFAQADRRPAKVVFRSYFEDLKSVNTAT